MGRGIIFFILFIVLAAVFLAGCSKALSEKISQETSDDSLDAAVDDSAVIDESVEDSVDAAMLLSTAKEGFSAAEASVKKMVPDAVFVGAKATIDAFGKSEAWTYSFDSVKNSKGYEITAGIVRENKFSFQPVVKNWLDSLEAAKKCGAGDATLEAGKWVVASEEGTCQLDAVTGEKDEI